MLFDTSWVNYLVWVFGTIAYLAVGVLLTLGIYASKSFGPISYRALVKEFVDDFRTALPGGWKRKANAEYELARAAWRRCGMSGEFILTKEKFARAKRAEFQAASSLFWKYDFRPTAFIAVFWSAIVIWCLILLFINGARALVRWLAHTIKKSLVSFV